MKKPDDKSRCGFLKASSMLGRAVALGPATIAIVQITALIQVRGGAHDVDAAFSSARNNYTSENPKEASWQLQKSQ